MKFGYIITSNGSVIGKRFSQSAKPKQVRIALAKKFVQENTPGHKQRAHH